MFDATSRYYSVETATYTTSDGRNITYARRRLLPRGENLDLMLEVKVDENDRLDRIAWKTLGNPALFWRIADASDAMNPFDLTDLSAQVLRVPIPSSQG